ncbi:NADH-quinone oxidoreductase subunit M [Catalinimonas alkaloidigena]|uniref:complex I subunit 4 family protein n=1 Tax=Catalinimonas alkaloidigena TaxID=1075417 RepID=UPI002404C303|nr:NADH-quinone oxidoreductase subunit M [Catalinimonas alkaloidigena]MDF9799213.1 NADH-quinone oxidoreductase subunit M [Catalinimonas alkaloidigena]
MEDFSFPILSIIIFLPLIGALVVLFTKPDQSKPAYGIGITSSALSLLSAILLWIRGVEGSFSQVEELTWIPSLGAAYRVGVDGISFPLVLLTTLLFLTSLIFSTKIKEKAQTYVALVLLLETACLGVFLSLDLLLFYVFFEITLVGMYFIIAGWGHEHAKKAALTFFIYTLVGSLFLLLALLSLYLHADPHTFDMREFIAAPVLKGLAAALTFWGFFLAFAIKTPLFPFHTWLPTAHTEAPAPGSAILAGVLLKLGAYGFIRFALQMMPEAFREFAPFVMVIAVISALYGAFVALAQTDIKRMVAYTSVNHMGYLVFGVAVAAVAGNTARTQALDGAVLQMVSHGVVTGALFLLVGSLQDRVQTREMANISGLLHTAPVLGGLFILASFASLGLPGLAHFPAEFQIFLGGFSVYPVAVGFIVIGLLITSGLYLRAIQKVFMGKKPEGLTSRDDLHAYELWALIPLILSILTLGLFPEILLSVIHETTKMLGI